MNKQRRKDISTAISLLEQAREIIESAQIEEQECLDNMPENLWGSERYETIKNNATTLEEVNQDIETMVESLNEIIQ